MEPSKNICPGCRTHFEIGDKLPLEGIHVELKNYMLPIKEQKHKWILLKTICSFLNSKGGTIFIGAEDTTGEVKGVNIQRKEQDEFMLFVQQLISRIQPKVDLSDREDVIVQFIPVVEKGKFMGKYLIKMIVKQGEPSELYCFNQKVHLQERQENKIDEFHVVYAYVRINMGSVKELTGYELVSEAKNKALKPSKIFNCFHDNCNPDPVNMSVEILKIGFSNFPNNQLREILQQWFQSFLNDIQIHDTFVGYDEENDMLVIEFTTKPELVKAEEFINKNIEELNRSLEGECSFDRKGVFLDCIKYENKIKKVGTPQKEVKSESVDKKKYRKKQDFYQEETEDIEFYLESEQNIEILQENKQKNSKRESNNFRVEEERIEMILNMKEEMIIKPQKQRFAKKHSLTFTHINPKRKENLIEFLENLSKKEKLFEIYENTIEVFLKSQNDLLEFEQVIVEFREELSQFGFKNEIKIGGNTAQIDIHNFDKRKVSQLKQYLAKSMANQLFRSEANFRGNRCVLSLALVSPKAACEWLDKLLIDKEIKVFKIPGAENGKSAKMKVYLICESLTELDHQY